MTPQWLILYGLLCAIINKLTRQIPKDTFDEHAFQLTGIALIIGGLMWWLITAT